MRYGETVEKRRRGQAFPLSDGIHKLIVDDTPLLKQLIEESQDFNFCGQSVVAEKELIIEKTKQILAQFAAFLGFHKLEVFLLDSMDFKRG